MLPDRIPEQRILLGAPATLRAVLADQDGEDDTTLDSGVTVTVTRLDGTALATAQAATCANGVATYSLTAAQTGAGLDVLTAAWTHDSVVRATTYHEVVGRHWFRASDLRLIPGVDIASQSPPGDTTDQALLDARTWIESVIEHATNVAWVPRTALEYHDARGHDEVVLDRWYPRTLRTLTIDGTAQTVGNWTLTPHGTLRRTVGGPIVAANAGGVVPRYDHGRDMPPPDLVRAAMIAAADQVTSRISTLGNRLTGTSGTFGTISYASIDKDHPTGIPAVDAAILAHRLGDIGIG